MRSLRARTGLAMATLLWVGGAGEPAARAEVDPRLLESAQAALKAQDPARAQRLLESAYRTSRDPQLLLHLGRVAAAAQRAAAAADLFRRYLDTLGERADEAAQREIAAHLAHLAREGEPLGEVLITAEGSGVLLVDGSLAGALPLPGPVLVGAGPHRFRIESGSRRYESDALAVPPGRQAELRLSPGAHGTAVAVLTLSPVVVLRAEGPTARLLSPAVGRAATEAAQREHAVLYPSDKAAALLASRPASCLEAVPCLGELLGEAQARALLTLRLGEGGRGPLSAELVDGASGDVAATATGPLPADEPGRAAAVGALVRKVLAAGLLRPRGGLAIGSLPPGAEVRVDGRPRGPTPLERPSLAGRHQVQLTLPGHTPYQVEVQVEAGQTATVQARLVPLAAGASGPVAAGLSPSGRPRWRLAVGGVLLGAGVLLAGFGISALAMNGGCADAAPPVDGAECDYFYSTRAVGGALVGVGAAALIGGVVLLALPPRQTARVLSLRPPAGTGRTEQDALALPLIVRF